MVGIAIRIASAIKLLSVNFILESRAVQRILARNRTPYNMENFLKWVASIFFLYFSPFGVLGIFCMAGDTFHIEFIIFIMR